MKLILPLVAALPLLMAYGGGTGVAVPKPLQALLGLPGYLELGILYHAYMVRRRAWKRRSVRARSRVRLLSASLLS